jgi:hypothetical protein
MFLQQSIDRLRASRGMNELLKPGFVIGDTGSDIGVSLKAAEFRRENAIQDELLGARKPGIEIEGGEDGFQRVSEKRGLRATSALFFTSAETKIFADVEPLRDTNKMLGADEVGLQLGKLSLMMAGEAAE